MKLEIFLKARRENKKLKCETCGKEANANDLSFTNNKILCDRDSDIEFKKIIPK